MPGGLTLCDRDPPGPIAPLEIAQLDICFSQFSLPAECLQSFHFGGQKQLEMVHQAISSLTQHFSAFQGVSAAALVHLDKTLG